MYLFVYLYVYVTQLFMFSSVQRCSALNSVYVSTERTALLPTTSWRSTCGQRREKEHWTEACCLRPNWTLWTGSYACYRSTGARTCSFVRWGQIYIQIQNNSIKKWPDTFVFILFVFFRPHNYSDHFLFVILFSSLFLIRSVTTVSPELSVNAAKKIPPCALTSTRATHLMLISVFANLY